MPERFETIIIGGGVVGACALFQFAEHGHPNTILLERADFASGGTGKSCAIIRTHYSIASNTELAVRSLAMFRDLKTALDDPDADAAFVNSGYLILAKGETAEHLARNLAVQREHGANTERISVEQALELHPLLDLSDADAVGYEPESGYANPIQATRSFVRAAEKRGAQARGRSPVNEIIVESGEVRGVRTPSGDILADRVVCVAGPWTHDLVDPLGIDIPLVNYRHTVMTFRGSEPYRPDLPIVKDLTVQNKMYLRPEGETILAGTGDFGVPVDDPDDMRTQPDEDLIALQERQLAHRLPSFGSAQLAEVWFGPYDITPDWNPVIDAAPGIAGLTLAFGFSGHGFKLAPMVGRSIAQMVLGLPVDVDMTPYGLSRFVEGRQLSGVYGSGSIS